MIYKWARLLEHKKEVKLNLMESTGSYLEFKTKRYWELHKEDVTHQIEKLAGSHERSPPR